MALSHYLPSENLRLAGHRDIATFTITHTAGPGFEVFHGGEWYTVPCHSEEENVLNIICGDLLRIWSNDRFAASIHRVNADPLGFRNSIQFYSLGVPDKDSPSPMVKPLVSNPESDYAYLPTSADLFIDPVFEKLFKAFKESSKC